LTGGYTFCSLDEVKKGFPEFQRVMAGLKTDLVNKAIKDWGMQNGGMAPKAGQFGISTIMPELFVGFLGLPTAATLTTWHTWYNALGSNVILQGAAPGGAIYRGYKIGICGLAFLDKAIRISEIKMQISDAKLPRINIEEVLAYDNPAIIFEDSWILDEQTGFELLAYVTTLGPQRIKPIGLQLNMIPNKLQTSATGAALT